jgi:hypothetical protein
MASYLQSAMNNLVFVGEENRLIVCETMLLA